MATNRYRFVRHISPSPTCWEKMAENFRTSTSAPIMEKGWQAARMILKIFTFSALPVACRRKVLKNVECTVVTAT